MILTGRHLLEAFAAGHADAKSALQSWAKDVEAVTWITTQDVKNRYRSADYRPGNRIIFNIKGNKYRLVMAVVYQVSVVRVVWVGTHAEYDKMKF
jgi:mRNA interferase HigB